ncbi:MAG: UMP kinase [Christensenellaceae bacterium]|nr:UMP kinase [Christensenellaceae bacterium]
MKQKRVLIKLSGEALALHNNEKNIEQAYDFNQVNTIADVLVKAHNEGVQICLVIGGGNIWRGRQAGSDMNPATADQMGMLSTMLNCLCMADAIRQKGVKALVQSAVGMPGFADNFDMHKADEALENGKIVLFALGLGHPFFITDTAVVLRARQMQVDEILMAKNIDGVYSADPKTDPNAEFIPEISYTKALEMNLKVMDASAFTMLVEGGIPAVKLFSLKDPQNLLRVLKGEKLGTLLHK